MKEGDIVFCIDSSDHGKKQRSETKRDWNMTAKLIAKEDYFLTLDLGYPNKVLTRGKIYECVDISGTSTDDFIYDFPDHDKYYEVTGDDGNRHSISKGRFFSIEETREMKLKEIGL